MNKQNRSSVLMCAVCLLVSPSLKCLSQTEVTTQLSRDLYNKMKVSKITMMFTDMKKMSPLSLELMRKVIEKCPTALVVAKDVVYYKPKCVILRAFCV